MQKAIFVFLMLFSMSAIADSTSIAATPTTSTLAPNTSPLINCCYTSTTASSTSTASTNLTGGAFAITNGDAGYWAYTGGPAGGGCNQAGGGYAVWATYSGEYIYCQPIQVAPTDPNATTTVTTTTTTTPNTTCYWLDGPTCPATAP